jgi:hypothetical protein
VPSRLAHAYPIVNVHTLPYTRIKPYTHVRAYYICAEIVNENRDLHDVSWLSRLAGRSRTYVWECGSVTVVEYAPALRYECERGSVGSELFNPVKRY